MNGYFEFQTRSEQQIWKQELLGQLSDGQYECSNVNWEWWHSLPTKVGDETKVHSDEEIMMNTEIDFTELEFLFGNKKEKGIRSKFANKDKLNIYLQRISDAMNEFAIIDENYDPYRTCDR